MWQEPIGDVEGIKNDIQESDETIIKLKEQGENLKVNISELKKQLEEK